MKSMKMVAVVAGLGLLAGCSLFDNSSDFPPPVVNTPSDSAPATAPVVADTRPVVNMGPFGGGSTMTGTVALAGRFQVVVATYSKPENAAQAVKFLAENGIKAATAAGSSGNTSVVSADTYATRNEADALRVKVVEVGKKHPSAKAGASVWADAYIKTLK